MAETVRITIDKSHWNQIVDDLENMTGLPQHQIEVLSTAVVERIPLTKQMLEVIIGSYVDQYGFMDQADVLMAADEIDRCLKGNPECKNEITSVKA